MNAAETFHAHGHDWTPHKAGDEMPVDGDTQVYCLTADLECEDWLRPASHWIWSTLDGDPDCEIIGWRYAEPAAPRRLTQFQLGQAQADELATLREENERLRDDLEYLASTKAPKLWRRMILAESGLSKAQKSSSAYFVENANMRTAIKEAVNSLTLIREYQRDFTAPEFFYWNAMDQSRDALAKLSPFLP